MATKMRRWRLLDQLDDWLRVPMLVLSLLWLVIVLAELMGAGHRLLVVFGTLIWTLFIVEFVRALRNRQARRGRRAWRTEARDRPASRSCGATRANCLKSQTAARPDRGLGRLRSRAPAVRLLLCGYFPLSNACGFTRPPPGSSAALGRSRAHSAHSRGVNISGRSFAPLHS